MPDANSGLVAIIVGPAITAAIVTYVLNTRDERRRTYRDAITKAFEETRADIQTAVSAGVAYSHCADLLKVPELAAQVLLSESDVRSGLAGIREHCDDLTGRTLDKLRETEGNFLDALTGGDFESHAAADPDRARRLIGIGSMLRSDLARIRREQLKTYRTGGWSEAAAAVLALMVASFLWAAGFYSGWVISTSNAPH